MKPPLPDKYRRIVRVAYGHRSGLGFAQYYQGDNTDQTPDYTDVFNALVAQKMTNRWAEEDESQANQTTYNDDLSAGTHNLHPCSLVDTCIRRRLFRLGVVMSTTQNGVDVILKDALG